MIGPKSREVFTGGKRYAAGRIIARLREAEVFLSQGQFVKHAGGSIESAEQTFYRWRKGYGGMKVSQAKSLKELERKNTRLRKAASDLTLDKQILREALEGNDSPPAPPALCGACNGSAVCI